MNPTWIIVFMALGLLVAVMVCVEVGLRIGRYRLAKDADALESGTGVVDAAVFGILGLLIAFTFSGAAYRLDARRQLIAQEANAIGTAYLRLDLLPADARPPLRQLFRDYLDARLRMHERLLDEEFQTQYRLELSKLQGEIWSQCIAASRRDGWPPTATLLLPALNDMIDITTTRSMAIRTHIPVVIMVLLVVVSLVAGVLVGHAMANRKARSFLHMFLFSLVIAISIYVILDLEYPRLGLIRLDTADQALIQLRESIK